MLRLRKQPRTPIGLDLGARRVKAIQLAPSAVAASGWRVAAAACVSRAAPGTPFTPDEIARLADTLDRLGFTGTRVALAAPSDKLISAMLELPKNGQIPLEQIARVELARTNKIPPESFEMGCWELPVPARAGKAAHVMAVGYPHAEAAALLDVVESAGLDAVAMDSRSCALARACGASVAPLPAITALLDLGWSSASLVLVYSGMVVYVRTLAEAGIGRVCDGMEKRLRMERELVDYLLGEVGLREATGTTASDTRGEDAERLTLPGDARALLTNYADALVREMLVSFSYVARQYTDGSVTRLLLMGAGAAVPGIGEYLAKELGLETTALSPRDIAECPPELLDACSSPELTPAMGLAQFPET
jgi:Tfp pilus assembly PilM family ATPase